MLSDEIREVQEDDSELFEGLTSQQVFLWLQGLFLFALVWTVASTINADSRRKFDLFFRNLIMGLDDNNPRPKSVKLTKNNTFPEKGNLVPVRSFVCLFLSYYKLFGSCVPIQPKCVDQARPLQRAKDDLIACLGGFAFSELPMCVETGGLSESVEVIM